MHPAEIDVLESYIPQILRKLTSTGAAFIHHSNLLALSDPTGDLHGRAMSVSATKVADIVGRGDGKVIVQEIVNWGDNLVDCFTLFGRRSAVPGEPVFLENPRFSLEASLVKAFQSPYARGSGR